MKWDRIITFLDYHDGRWYGLIGGEWRKVTSQSIEAEFRRCGYDVNKLRKQFRDRDNQCVARKYKRQ
jgi:hypothetical protein